MLVQLKKLFKLINEQNPKIISDHQIATFKIKGMHCSSCSMNIDDALEENEGVVQARTSFARATSEIIYDPKLISSSRLVEIINSTGYQAYYVDAEI